MRISDFSDKLSQPSEKKGLSETMNSCSLILAVGLGFMCTPVGKQAIYDYQIKHRPENTISQEFKNFIDNNSRLVSLVEKNGGIVLEEKNNIVTLLFSDKYKIPTMSPELKKELAKCAVIETRPEKMYYPESSKVATYTLIVEIEITQSNYRGNNFFETQAQNKK